MGSDAEVLELYRKAYPRRSQDGTQLPRLCEHQLALLQRFEGVAAVQPQLGDLVGGWFNDRTAYKLAVAGIISLGELQARIVLSERCYQPLPAVDQDKAQQIAQYLDPPRATYAAGCASLHRWAANTMPAVESGEQVGMLRQHGCDKRSAEGHDANVNIDCGDLG
ncbi:MAG: hypothetical protein EOP06_04370 [Proteobacteria bacterium]|nr:MAG: hypothetical protein EOP06_04370 [Pseudomonadota bacterium]